MLRLPRRSPRRPYIGTSTAADRRYATAIHELSRNPPRLPAVAGGAVARSVGSTAARNIGRNTARKRFTNCARVTRWFADGAAALSSDEVTGITSSALEGVFAMTRGLR